MQQWGQSAPDIRHLEAPELTLCILSLQKLLSYSKPLPSIYM